MRYVRDILAVIGYLGYIGLIGDFQMLWEWLRWLW